MSLALLPLHYLYWHYLLAWRDGWQIYRDFLWFVGHFFSLKTLLRTWLQPWRRLGEPYQGSFDLTAWLSTLIVNLLMRLVGLIVRTFLLASGVLAWLLVFGAGLVAALVWLVLPWLTLGLLAAGLYLLI